MPKLEPAKVLVVQNPIKANKTAVIPIRIESYLWGGISIFLAEKNQRSQALRGK